MKKGNPVPLSANEKAELEALAAMPDSAIDTSDIPPQTNWAGAMRGAFYRPIKKPVSLRLVPISSIGFSCRGRATRPALTACCAIMWSAARRATVNAAWPCPWRNAWAIPPAACRGAA